MSFFRSGFAGILGRPNVGKSTLLNCLCGEKVAITSSKPQTTRNRIMGVLHGSDFQIVFVDTPGMHETDRAINRYMQQIIAKVAGDVDLLLFMADVTRTHGREDEMVLSVLSENRSVPVLLVVNKIDLATPEQLKERIDLLEGMHDFTSTVTTSALTGAGKKELIEQISVLLPEGVPYFPEDMVTDQPLGFILAEIIREKLFDHTMEEVPYATAVLVENMSVREDGLMLVEAAVFVEKESQKGIVIGKKGRMLQKAGTAARREMEDRLGRKVFLDLRVKVKKGWTDKEGLLRQMGYE